MSESNGRPFRLVIFDWDGTLIDSIGAIVDCTRAVFAEFDNDIRADIRSRMAQYRIDMQRVQLRVFGGTVRMSGEIYHLGGLDRPVSVGVLESFERDVVKTRGVRHAFFEFENWKRKDDGEWESVHAPQRETPLLELEEVFQQMLSLDSFDEREV